MGIIRRVSILPVQRRAVLFRFITRHRLMRAGFEMERKS